MANGFEALGAALGGDSEKAYQEGLFLGARTEDAMAAARERVTKNRAQMELESTLTANGWDPKAAKAASTALQAGANLGDVFKAQLQNQEFGFNQQIADPNVPLDVAQRMVLTKSTNPVEPLYKVGGGYGNKFDSAAGITPLGDALGGGDGGTAAGMQYMRALGLLNPDGSVKPGMEATAYDIIHPSGRVFDSGGVPQTTDFNPYRAGGPHAVAPSSGPAPAAPPVSAPAPAAAPTHGAAPLATAGDVASNVAQIAAAKSQAEAQGKNAASLPTALNTLDTFTKDIDALLAQPGFDSIYGHIAGLPIVNGAIQFASQDAANADALRNKINAESFRASINSMRGLGQLSNAEGEKVQAALTVLANPRISPQEARTAADNLKLHLAELRRVAQIEAGQGGAASSVAPGAPTAGETKLIGGKKYVKVNGQWYEDDGT